MSKRQSETPVRPNMQCPCLRQGIVGICAADRDAVRIPPQDHIVRICQTDLHRRCEIFRCFRGMRLATRREPLASAQKG